MPKGTQTLKELMTLLNMEFAELRKLIAFEYEEDAADYCRLAPLYWPKPTSYDNFIFASKLGKQSKFVSVREYKATDLARRGNPAAAAKFKEFKKRLKEEKNNLRN